MNRWGGTTPDFREDIEAHIERNVYLCRHDR
jgi:hypothetical protein